MNGNTQIQESLEASRLAKLQAQTASGNGPRPEVKAESDEDFAKSLMGAHNASYASRMARAGL